MEKEYMKISDLDKTTLSYIKWIDIEGDYRIHTKTELKTVDVDEELDKITKDSNLEGRINTISRRHLLRRAV